MQKILTLAVLAGALFATSAVSNARMGDPSITSAAQVSTSAMNGTYVFLTRGFVTGVSTTSAGSFVADGAGNITSGAMDMNTGLGTLSHTAFTGHYVGSGTDQIVVTLALPSGALTIPLYPGALNASSVATTLRAVTGGAGSSASGIFYLQNPAITSESVFPAGSFIFGLSGISGSDRATAVGRFDATATGSVTNGELDTLLQLGTVTQPLEALPLTGSFGISGTSLKATLTTSAVSAHFNLYPVSNDQVLMLGTDASSTLPPMAGTAIRQIGAGSLVEPDVRKPLAARTAASYGFTNGSVTGKSVFSLGGATGGSSGVAAVGLIAFDGSGSAAISSVQQAGGTKTTSSQAGIPYAVQDNGRLEVGASTSPALLGYVTDTGRGLLASTDASLSFGFIEPQTASSISTETLTAGGYLFGNTAPEIAQASQDAGIVGLDGQGNITGYVATDSGAGGAAAYGGSLGTYSIDSTGLLATSTGVSGYVVSPTRFVALLPGAGFTVPFVFDQAISGSVVPVKIATGTSLNASSTSVMSGTSVTLTASVTPTQATGSVTFKDGSSTIGMGTLSAGIATFTSSAFTVGPHALTAVYGGDSNYAGSTSSSLSLTVTAG